jgi:AraC family transcriptional regulator of adaptative response/methylated-DNA-[protein]-cysteine methyltransferase
MDAPTCPAPFSQASPDEASLDYARAARAIAYLRTHLHAQPSLDDLAHHLGLSPFHVQRLFTRWAGVSPKRFLQALTVDHAKPLLAQARPVLDVAHELGLSSASRLHDHFVQLEAMTPGEYQRGGAGLHIGHGLADTPFGEALLAWTPRGLCHLGFVDHEASSATEGPMQAQHALQQRWPRATFTARADEARQWAQAAFQTANAPEPPDGARDPVRLHVAGTNFQVQVWRALLQIAPAQPSSYGQLAQAIGRPAASRAVGQAVGANPVGFLVPCHRVIQQSGAIGGYRWGPDRKRVMLAWEAARALSD